MQFIYMVRDLSSNRYIIFYKKFYLNNINYNWEFASKLLEILDIEINPFYELILVKDEVSIFLFKNNLKKKEDNQFLFRYLVNDVSTYPYNLVMHSYTKFENLDSINVIIIFEKKNYV